MHNSAYFAGLFDGEGCVSAVTRKRNTLVRIQIAMTDARPILACHQSFGGSIAKYSPQNKRPYWVWSLSHKGGEKFLEAILPYSLVKREQIELALQLLCELKCSPYHNRFSPIPDNVLLQRASAVEALKALKRAVYVE